MMEQVIFWMIRVKTDFLFKLLNMLPPGYINIPEGFLLYAKIRKNVLRRLKFIKIEYNLISRRRLLQ